MCNSVIMFYFFLFSISSYFVPGMRFAIVGLALFWMIGTEGGVFEDNGMANIATIVSDIDDLNEASKDLEEMESRLNGLDKHQALIAQTKSDLTDALNKDSLANNFNHENNENTENSGRNYIS